MVLPNHVAVLIPEVSVPVTTTSAPIVIDPLRDLYPASPVIFTYLISCRILFF